MSVEWLDDSENRQFVRAVSLEVIEAIDAEEASFAMIFVDPALDAVASGETNEFAPSDDPGGFGDSQLLIMVVVPLVVNLISSLLFRVGEESIIALKEWWENQNDQEMVEIRLWLTREMVEILAKQNGMPQVGPEADELTKAIQAVLVHYMEQP